MKNPDKPHRVRATYTSGEQPWGWNEVKKVYPPVPRNSRPEPTTSLPDKVSPLRLAEIASALRHIDPDIEYLSWLKVLMAIHSEAPGEHGQELADRWSSTGKLYRPGEVEYRWDTFDREGNEKGQVTISSLFEMAHEGRHGEKWNGEIHFKAVLHYHPWLKTQGAIDAHIKEQLRLDGGWHLKSDQAQLFKWVNANEPALWARLKTAFRKHRILRDIASAVLKSQNLNAETNAPKFTKAVTLFSHHFGDRLKFNGFTQKSELDGDPITDKNVSEFRLWLEKKTLKNFSKEVVFDAVMSVCHLSPYDPLADYLNNLQWDGVERIDDWLIDVYGAEHSQYVRDVGRRCLISGAARGLKPGAKVRQSLLLQGEEEIGKSLSLSDLCPHRDWFTDSLPPDLHTKDAAITVQGKFIIESSEMASMQRSQQEAVKAFLSRDIDDYRPPYGKCNITAPRRCIIVGTTNHDDVLSFRESNTRFLPIRVQKYNREYLIEHRDQLWAEAVHRFKNGEPWWVNDSQEAKEARENFKEEDAWAEWIRGFLEEKIRKGITQVAATEFLDIIDMDIAKQNKSSVMRVTGVFKSLGWKKVHTREGNRWMPSNTQE